MFDDDRPKLKLEKNNTQKAIELLTLACIAFCFLYPAIHYSNLPDQVPMHFNFKGEVDNQGSKQTVWALAIIGALLSIGLYKLSQYPHIFNYPIKITKENAFKHYTSSVKMIVYLNLLCAILFALICYQIVNIALQNDNQFGQWSQYAFYAIIGLLIIGPLVIVIKQASSKEEK